MRSIIGVELNRRRLSFALYALVLTASLPCLAASTASGAVPSVQGSAQFSLSANPFALSPASVPEARAETASATAAYGGRVPVSSEPPVLFAAPFGPARVNNAARTATAARSRAAFAHLSDASAVGLAERVFAVQQPTWQAPEEVAGTRITSYLGDFTASAEAPGQKHMFISSTVPLRSRHATGRLAPVSLALKQIGESYEPANPLVPVTIARNVQAGVALPEGLVVTPVGLRSAAPSLVGNHVIFANSQTDTDFMLSPMPAGAEVSWQLRSANSPSSLALRFHLRPAESLRISRSVPGAVEVVRQGAPSALVEPASAVDAAGETVPTSYTLNGTELTTHVSVGAHPVQFPVMVDPVIVSFYGEANGDNQWQWWQPYSPTCGGCFGFPEYANLLQLGAEYNWPEGNWGEWYLPGPASGVARITRADVSNLVHQPGNQSSLNLGIAESNGPNPGIWTTNGFAGAMGQQPLVTNTAYSNTPFAVCADGGGGTDGNGQLCNFNYGGTSLYLGLYLLGGRNVFNWASISAATVRWIQTQHPSVSLVTPPPGGWFNSTREGSVRVRGEDTGIGVSSIGVDAVGGIIGSQGYPTPYGSHIIPGTETYNPACNDPYCALWAEKSDSLAGLGTGIYTLGAWAHNGAFLESVNTYDAFIDNTPPEIATPSWAGATLGNGPHELAFSAQDGSQAAPQSGTYSIALYFDGRRVSEPPTNACGASPTPPNPNWNCYGLSGSWTTHGEELAPGPHTVTIQAKDWTGNTSERTFTITIAHPAQTTQQLGPGKLNLLTGDYRLKATDASVEAGAAGLSVSRTYNSQVSPPSGPLGPGWMLSLPDLSASGEWQSLEVLSNGNVEATTTEGHKALFVMTGNGFSSPAGFQSYTLTEASMQPTMYQITDSAGDYTQFEKPEGASAFMPKTVAQASGAGGLNKVTYIISAGHTSEVIGPEPEGISCQAKLERGCRALKLEYATSTSAKGESESEWGSFNGQIEGVSFIGWDSAKGEMRTIQLARYAYDGKGRLRAEWDPRVTPSLKTVYGYDGEGHLVALSPPGQEPFIFNYKQSGSPSVLKLMSVSRPGASAALGSANAPVSKAAPKLSSSSPTVGTTLKVNNGTWSNSPLTGVYSYQWYDCNSGGAECAPIVGAINPSYTPQEHDGSHTLVAVVTATNALGASTGTSAASGVVPQGTTTNNPAPAQPKTGETAVTTVEYGLSALGSSSPCALTSRDEKVAQGELPVEGTAVFAASEPEGWPAQEYSAANSYCYDSLGRRVNVVSAGGAVDTEEYDAFGNVVRELSPTNRLAAEARGAESASYAKLVDSQRVYSKDGTKLESSLGPVHEVKLANGSVVQARAHTQYTYDEEKPGGGEEVWEAQPDWVSGSRRQRKVPHRLGTKTTEGALIVSGGEGEADVRTIETSYSGQNGLGWELHKPTSVTVDPGGANLTRTNRYDETTGNVVETTTPAGAAENPIPTYSLSFGGVGSGNGQFEAPWGVAVNQKTGNVYVSDSTRNRVEEFSPSGAFIAMIGAAGSGEGQMSKPEALAVGPSGELYVGDSGNERVDVFNEEGKFVRSFGSKGTAAGQFGGAIDGIAASSSSVYVSDTANNRIDRFSTTGSAEQPLGGEGSGNGQFHGPSGIALALGGENLYVADYSNHRVQELSTTGSYVRQFGGFGRGNGQLEAPIGVAIDPRSGDVYVADYGPDKVEQFTAQGGFVAWLGASFGAGNGQFNDPVGVATSASGELYTADRGNVRVDAWAPAYAGPHTTLTIYYSAAANSKYPSCGEHPEWAGLPCQSRPSGQPVTHGLSEIGATETTYDIWDQPVTTTVSIGSSRRTSTNTYDEAGRPLTSQVIASSGKALPTATNTYSQTTGTLVKQSMSADGKEEKLESSYNALGQLTASTDASGNTSLYTYDIDGRLETVNDGKGTQTDTYDPTTGFLTKLVDSAAGNFTATYSVEGQLTSETYPNKMKASYTFDAIGETTKVEYWKGASSLYHDQVTPSIHGQWLSQQSTLSSDNYTYNSLGQLTQAQETPQGKGCTVTQFVYNEDASRTSETKREPGAEGNCATSGGTTTTHIYDNADRLNDTGTEYDAFGDAKALSAADTGGHPLETSFYANGAVYAQTQGEQTNTYHLDPAGRDTEIESLGGGKAQITINHYSGTATTPSWTSSSSGSTTRRIAGIGGSLAALQTNSETPILQLVNLHGDVVGTILDSTEPKSATLTSEPTAFGVPTTSSPSPFGWLGASGLETELASGVANTMTGSSYVPQVGIYLEPEALAGSPNQDPLNEYLDNRGLAQSTGTAGATSPGAVEPGPLTTQLESEFWAHPPWDKPPTNGPGGGDPNEVLTAKQAYSLAKAMLAQAVIYGADIKACNEAENAPCAAYYETVKDFYGIGSDELKGCAAAVEHGRHDKHGDFENGVCWISWEYSEGGDADNLQVEQCWSGGIVSGRYGLNEWNCPGHGWRKLKKLSGLP